MHKVSQVVRFRTRRYASEKRHPWLTLSLIAAILACLAVISLAFISISYAVNLTRSLPSLEILPTLLDPPDGLVLHPTQFFDRSGEHILLTLENPGAKSKQFLYVAPGGKVGVDQATSYLVNATLLETDPDFWTNPGFKLAGISERSHLTVAQILTNEFLLAEEPPSTLHAIRERILAAQITSRFGREKLLEWYLNTTRYGDVVYGADAAARVYFGKPAAQLSFAESVMLVAMAEMPSIDPRGSSSLVKKQQELIIQKMLVKGLVTGIEAQQALHEKLHFEPPVTTQSITPDFTSVVMEQISSIIPLERLYLGGYQVITTLDYHLQAQTDCAVKAQLATLSGNLAPLTALDGMECRAADYLPILSGNVTQRSIDQAAEVAVIDPRTGQVLAYASGHEAGVTEVYPGSHPAGTILSPLLYLTAFARGMSPSSLVWDIPAANQEAPIIPLNIKLNEDSASSFHGPVSVRQAMVNDYKAATNEVMSQVGIKNVVTTNEEFGITGDPPDNSDSASVSDFASQRVTLLKIIGAYAVLANQGLMAGEPNHPSGQPAVRDGLSPTSILAVKQGNGQVILDWTKPQEIRVTNPGLAYLVTHILSDDKARSELPGHADVLETGFPAAVKVSVDSAGTDAWVVGYTPKQVVAVWMGTPVKADRQVSADLAGGLWHAVIAYAASQAPVEEFPIPQGIKLVQVCEPSGMLPSPLCPSVAREVFLESNQPTQVDNLYQEYAIDRETGNLATIFTPRDLVENKVYLNIPAEAKTWAKTAGQAIPPDTYDSISTLPQPAREAHINSPEMFDYVKGLVEITGSAGGEGFSYFRLEVGKGLYPTEWLQIGEDTGDPVGDGTLGTWDTSSLNGLYVIKLLVVRDGGRFDEAFLQVTVDNTPPHVSIVSPKQGESFTFQPGQIIALTADGSDDIALSRLEFYVDGNLVSTVLDPHYVVLWKASVGRHSLQVKGFDLAGNIDQATISFMVSK